MSKPNKETLLEQERFELKPKSGGGLLSYKAKNKAGIKEYNHEQNRDSH